MRMSEFHIDGFGRFHNLSVSDLGPGLSVVLGSNEAGKSTLLAFLRSVLFGFPTRKQAEFFPALNGGRHGGRMVLIDSQSERITVERFAGKGSGQFSATFATGSQISEEQFRQRIGAVTGDVYQNVFAFGLGELQEFKNLQDGSIRDAIYGAGIGSGRHSPREVVDSLEKQYKKLFVPGGSNPVMNSLLKQIEQRRQLIQAHHSDPQEYQRLRSELATADAAIDGIEHRLRDSRQRQARLETLKRAREDWTSLKSNRARLQDLPLRESFPQDGVQRLETFLNEQRPLQSQLPELRDDHLKAVEKLTAISVDEAFLSLASEIRNLERGVQLFEQQRRDLADVQTEQKQASQQLSQNLRDLGDEWTVELLASFDLSIPAREEFDAARRACEEAQTHVAKQAENVARLSGLLQERHDEERAENLKLEQIAGPAANLDVIGIRGLQRRLASYELAAHDLPRVLKECQGNEVRLFETLRSINPDWSEDRLNRFDNSLVAREKLSNQQKILNGLHSEFAKLQHRVETIQQKVEEHQAEVAYDEAELLPLTRSSSSKFDEASFRKIQERLRSLRSDLDEYLKLQADLAHQTERHQDLAAQLTSLEHETEGTATGLPRWLVPVIALLGVLGLLVMGIGRSDWITGIVVAVIFFIVAGLLLTQRNVPSTAQDRRTQRLQDQKGVTQRFAAVEQRMRDLKESESELKSRIVKQLDVTQTKVPFSGKPNETHTIIKQISEKEAKIDQELSLLQKRHPIEQRLADNRSKLDRAQSALREATMAQKNLKGEQEKAQTDWRAWLSSVGLPETLTPELSIDALSRLDSARELLKSIERDRERVRAMRGEIDRYQESVRIVAMSSNIDNIPEEPLAAVQFLLDELSHHNERERRVEIAQQRLDEAKQQTERDRKLHDEARRRHDAEVIGQKNVRQQWIALLQRRGLRETLSVDHGEKMWQGIENARAKHALVDDLGTKEHALSEQITEFVGMVGAVTEKTGLPLSTVNEVSRCIDTLATSLAQTEEARRNFDTLREQIEQSAPRIKRLETQIGDLQRNINGLLTAAGVDDEETFRRRSAEYHDSQSLIQEVRSLETRLQQLCGGDDAALSRLEKELEYSIPEAQQTEQQELTERIEQLDTDNGQQKEYCGSLKLQLQQLEKSEEISQFRMQEQADLAMFREHAREWSILRIAAHLVDRARQKYERERRPAVLKRAEQYFARLTQGRYLEILAPAGSDPSVVAADRSKKELHQLSRGTAEQLYLSLRFGFIEEFVARAEPLPLIFDDILVNFDPHRAHAAAEAIADLAKSQQILLFTCQPSTVQLLQTVCCDIPVLELQDGKLKDGSQQSNQENRTVGTADGKQTQ